jgi:hypothetical protein
MELADNRHPPAKLDGLKEIPAHLNDSPTWLFRLNGIIVQVMSNSKGNALYGLA